MQTFSLLIVQSSTEPNAQPPDRKIAEGVVLPNGTCRVTFLSRAIKCPQIYRTIDELQLVHCGEGSKVRLTFES
jgi:hypothetical protein